jgi:IS5 family transposase
MAPAAAGQLDRLNELVKWYRFEKIAGHLRDAGSPGRPGWPVLVLLKAVLLQSLYGLSERELEEALNDRLSFRRFVGLSLETAAPDHSVLNRFRNRLISEGLLEKLFAELDRQLEKAGVVLKRGTMLDATLIETEAARKAMGKKHRLARRPTKHHPVLPPRMQLYNRLIARRRAAVETTFATLKRRMGLTAIRYIGLAKASAQVLLAAMAFNMRRWVTLNPA